MPNQTLTVTFLGTGTSSGVPMVGCQCQVCTSGSAFDNRLRSSVLLQSKETTVVIDATPDFRYQMLRQQVRGIDALLLTHPHKDHLGGLDDTRAFQYIQQRSTAVYGNAMTLEGVKRELPYAFGSSPYPGVPALDLHTIENEPFSIGDITFIPILVWHLRMPVFGYRIGPFVYITDANRIDSAELDKLGGCHTLVLNALRHEPHISHFTLDEAIAVAQESGCQQAYFTHISHQLGLHHAVNANLPPGIALAFDGLKLHFEY
ncbi:MAG: MBL fold metallo-hydrolase [Bacteroidetes bacterium]|nr:MAG: MBL fold metallo-hydrolase [Bacteroidota bacterium]